MRIAISTDDGSVSAHFGRCPFFTIVDIEDSRVAGKETIENPGHHPGFLPRFLRERGVNCVIAGGMGQRAEQLFLEEDIERILGISGTIDSVIDSLIAGKLKGGESLCQPGKGKGYGLDKSECDHAEEDHHH
jgi:predicted Fe-Mo cluster-binding NifX family protein